MKNKSVVLSKYCQDDFCEVILSIREVTDRELDTVYDREKLGGYLIKTNKQDLYILCSIDQQCCEEFGYIMTNDDISSFIGSMLYKVEIICENRREFLHLNEIDEFVKCLFIDFHTSEGVLQFVAYNSNSDYYGHTVLIHSKSLKKILWV